MKILEDYRSSSPEFKKNFGLILLAYFFVLFNYPLIRASSTSLFFDAYGAKSSPEAWIWSVLSLTLTIFISNKLQTKLVIQKVFAVFTVFTTLLFSIGFVLFEQGMKLPAYSYFVWKEVYIVVQVHLILAYCNIFFSKDQFKKMVGPVGAIGSIGGVLGGLLTTYLSQKFGTGSVVWAGQLFVFLPALFFYRTPGIVKPQELEEKKESPLSSLKESQTRNYVLLIISMVALTQFIINIIDFRFNLGFEAAISDKEQRTAYLGNIYTITNALTFAFQFVLLPLILPRIKDRSLHLFIPVSYLLCGMLYSFFGGGLNFIFLASFYIYVKACDYSLFSAGKELLYQPLRSEQKYGAKYLTDMLAYRMAKALIAIVLIYFQSSLMLDYMGLTFILMWLIVVFQIFKRQRQLTN
jgi:AAA family ATP:ADP antiporter